MKSAMLSFRAVKYVWHLTFCVIVWDIEQGTSKEYIGDDTEEIRKAVKHALQQCCQQLRGHLVRRNALRDQRERKKVLTKVRPTAEIQIQTPAVDRWYVLNSFVLTQVYLCPLDRPCQSTSPTSAGQSSGS